MGVPVFFKWMCMRNPKILKDAKQALPDSYDNPNPYVDNFYVDMNGLIHPSCNPKEEKIKEPANFQQQCSNIFQYLDKLMNIIRPKKLVYLAIDGVAPRAKMNQQRTRRFRAAMQGEEISTKKYDLLDEYKKKFIDTEQIEEYMQKKRFDSNVITPGTPFLDGVGTAIRGYIKNRLANHRFWKNITVIFSDANIPGQGEHKIMDFIRQQRASVSYDPNQHHCIYGADADLIMLGLATHEPRFYIIREIVVQASEKWCSSCGRRGHYFVDCRPADSIQNEAKVQEQINAGNINVSFQFINLKLIRQFMHLSFKDLNIAFQYNIQRILDDFVFLCFFVGNDFLPHIPCLTIREGGIDMLLKVYEFCLSIMPDYITHAGVVNFSSLKVFVQEMTVYQKDIIRQIIIKEQQQKQRQHNDRHDKNKFPVQNDENNQINFVKPLDSFKAEIKNIISANNQNNLQNYSVFNHNIYNYKEKYYKDKFKIKPKDFLQFKNNISQCYLEALSWICYYYYKGVASWGWFYPFHYSPFFSDLFVKEAPTFQIGRPFKPYEQLLAVLPPKTCQVLPLSVRPLMTTPQSPIADYFPSEFQIDLLGKKFKWLGEVLLPFIDDSRLLQAMGPYEKTLTAEQKRLNRLGTITLYINKYGDLGRKLTNFNEINEETIIVDCQRYGIQGLLKNENKGQNLNDNVIQWQLIPPHDRSHDINLKSGISFSQLQELNDEFIRKLDKKSYGGERFIRIIQRSLVNRAHTVYNRPPENPEGKRPYSNDNRNDNRGGRRDERDDRDNRGNRFQRGGNRNNQDNRDNYRDRTRQKHGDNYKNSTTNSNNQERRHYQNQNGQRRDRNDYNKGRDNKDNSY